MEDRQIRIGNYLIASFFIALILYMITTPVILPSDMCCGGEITLAYQEGHEKETADFKQFVFEDFPEYIFFENLNDSYCYWVGRSFKRDASLHFTQIGYKNSSIVLIQWSSKLQAVWLLRGDPLDHLTFVLLLSVDW